MHPTMGRFHRSKKKQDISFQTETLTVPYKYE